MVDSVNNSASLYVSGVKNLKFKYTIYWINFRKNSKRPSTPPHFRKIMLQIFMIVMVAYMQGGMMKTFFGTLLRTFFRGLNFLALFF